MKAIAIIGAGGHTRSSINLLKQVFKNCKLSIFDNSFDDTVEEFVGDIKLIGNINDVYSNNIFLSIGDNKQRSLYFDKFNKQVIKNNLFHESSHCEEGLEIGIANQIFANVYMNSYVTIGDNNIFNTSVVVEHEVQIGNHNHMAVGVNLCGRVKIANNCMIGAGTTVIDKISICSNVFIGAGSTVVKNIIESGTYVGSPAIKIK